MNISTYTSRSPLLIAVCVAIVAASLVAISLAFLDGGSKQDSATAHASATVAAAVDEQMAKMNVKPRTVELTLEKAMRVRNAIRQGEYSTAYKITAEILANSRLQDWDFYPFSAFIAGIADVDDPAFEAHLNEWVAENKNDVIALLVRAQYYHDMGWFKRGRNFVRQTQAGNLDSFETYMGKALADIDGVIHLNDGNPYSFYLRLRILHGFGLSVRLKDAFEEAIAKYPGYYPLYDIVLTTLQPKWGGAVEAMYGFVDRYAGSVPDSSPLKLLYLSLYRDLLSSASISCNPYWRDGDKFAQCVASSMRALIRSELEHQVQAVLQLYDHSDKYQFGVAVEDILFSMLGVSGGDFYAGAILQLAASSMHSDTQLRERKLGQNDYVIDKVVAESWYMKGFYDNALKKDQEALKDVEAAVFPSEKEKDLAIASIYEHIARVYDMLHLYVEMIAYQKAAIALGDKTTNAHFICYGYYQLKAYDDALQACTKTIESDPKNLAAYYWRGKVYHDMGKPDAALQDLTVVAESEHGFRAPAAIEMSMIHFDRKDIPSALKVLNKYEYLYDPEASSRDNIAVSYNNRCYAYMELGELKKALDDCRASLEFGSLPDAYRKEQELVKRLGIPDKDL